MLHPHVVGFDSSIKLPSDHPRALLQDSHLERTNKMSVASYNHAGNLRLRALEVGVRRQGYSGRR